MESLKGANSDGATAELSEAASDNVDRIVLRRIECNKLDRWLADLNKRFDGMIRVTKSDLANFVIRHHSDELSQHEIDLIEGEFYDEVRWLNWALAKIRQAKKEGRALSLEDLMKSRGGADGKKTVSNRGGKKRRKVVTTTGDPPAISEAGPTDAD